MGNDTRIREIVDEMRQVGEIPFNEKLIAYKNQGGKIIGTLYNQVPEEIIYAAGMLPVRLRDQKATGTEGASGRFTNVNCSLVKYLYDSASKGRFAFADGIVGTNACDHARKLEENWASELNPGYAYLICFPKRYGDDLQVDHLAGEYKSFAKDLEEHFDVDITEENLRRAIALFNEIRSLQMQLAKLRARKNPPISGTDMLAVQIASTCMPREEYRDLLKELVQLCEETSGIEDYQARVVVYGGEIDSLELMEAIESQGALIVGDSLGGFGRRSSDMQISLEGEDLIRNIAQAYLHGRPTEPRLHGTRANRWSYLEAVADEVGADGFIQIHIPICDLWSYERMMFDTEVEKNNLTCLDLDTEYIFATPGQTRTRVQAFVEQITEGGR